MCLASIVMSEALSPSIVSFASATAQVEMSRPAPQRLLEGDPETITRNYFSDSTGRLFAGVWESTRGRWRVRYTENEFCHVTQGRMRIESERGESWAFAAGDSFVVPAGFVGTWEVLEPMKKLYVIYDPAAR